MTNSSTDARILMQVLELRVLSVATFPELGSKPSAHPPAPHQLKAKP